MSEVPDEILAALPDAARQRLAAAQPAPLGARELRADALSQIAGTPFFARMLATRFQRETVLEAFAAMPLPAPVAAQVAAQRALYPDAYEHAVQSGLVAGALWLAVEPSATRYDVGMLVAAGVLHDLAMLAADPALHDPAQPPLGDAARAQLLAHPQASARLLEPHHVYPRELVRAITEHHERLDGSGYPRGLGGDAISAWGRVLSITEVVSAMFGGGREHPELRLSTLLRMNPGRYDPTLVETVGRWLAPALDAEASAFAAASDPFKRLRALHTALDDAPRPDGLGPRGAAMFDDFHARLGGLQRSLADAGADAAQLGWLAAAAPDARLRAELVLIGREASWQLRMLAQQLQRRFGAAPLPPTLRGWFDRVEALVADA
ncbi:HD-GYP domain-containing protein [Caldimonas sp. KR1-144]|uniref:HD-GYP domain-containing protein n=1 Tax=Caldimonas sp. KR1-144 TaxID=3400911 RepID=UPI003C0AB3A3